MSTPTDRSSRIPGVLGLRALALHLSEQYNHEAVTEAVKANNFDLARQMVGAIDVLDEIRGMADAMEDDNAGVRRPDSSGV